MLERLENNYILTYTGKKFWPLNPTAEDIDILDIAHGLSLKCRFTGQCKSFYSVAQHSILVAERQLTRELSLWGLLHDAAESYLADIPSPYKNYVSIAEETFRDIENRLLKMIIEKFGLSWPEPQEVKIVDKEILILEKQELLYSGKCSSIFTWNPMHAEDAFLTAFMRFKRG